MAEKKTKGKQKIEIKKIENDDDRMITFSKRKTGIHKKMNELIATCNVEIGFLAFSGAGTPFTFAHPSMEAIANKLMNPFFQPPRNDAQLVAEAYRQQHINELIREYERLVEELDMEKKREKELEKLRQEMELNKYWWTTPVEEMNEEDVKKARDAFVKLHDNLCDIIVERLRVTQEGPSSGVEPHHLVGPENVNETNPLLSIPPGDGSVGDKSAGGR